MTYGPPDHRTHKSFVDPTAIEFITKLRHDDVAILNAFMQEALEFEDDTMLQSCKRLMTLRTAVNGARAELMAKVAVHDETLRNPSETRVGGKSPEEPKGP